MAIVEIVSLAKSLFMNDMNDTTTPTPRTDALRNKLHENINTPNIVKYMETVLHANELERELTAAREEIENLKFICKCESESSIEAHDILKAVTEQRDRLAEALKKAKAVYTPSSGGEYQTGWHDAICWVNQQALQSLNQNASVEARP